MTNIERLEKQIEEIRAEIERLKDNNKEELERADHYYFINIDGAGDFYVDENDNGMTTKKYDNWNYFRSEESGANFLSVINELKKLQHYHDIYCPDYVPNWNDKNEKKWSIIFDKSNNKYQYIPTCSYCYRLNEIYFDSEEIARKVCNRLNKNL